MGRYVYENEFQPSLSSILFKISRTLLLHGKAWVTEEEDLALGALFGPVGNATAQGPLDNQPPADSPDSSPSPDQQARKICGSGSEAVKLWIASAGPWVRWLRELAAEGFFLVPQLEVIPEVDPWDGFLTELRKTKFTTYAICDDTMGMALGLFDPDPNWFWKNMSKKYRPSWGHTVKQQARYSPGRHGRAIRRGPRR